MERFGGLFCSCRKVCISPPLEPQFYISPMPVPLVLVILLKAGGLNFKGELLVIAFHLFLLQFVKKKKSKSQFQQNYCSPRQCVASTFKINPIKFQQYFQKQRTDLESIYRKMVKENCEKNRLTRGNLSRSERYWKAIIIKIVWYQTIHR